MGAESRADSGSQREGNNEIWVDLYALTRFLAKHTQAVKVEGTKEWVRTNGIVDPAVEEYEAQTPVELQIPVGEDSLERDEPSETQPESSGEQSGADDEKAMNTDNGTDLRLTADI